LLIASSGTTPNNYLYCGQQLDSDLGFYYLRARYYKPDSGRFWTMDSFEGNNEDPQSLHKYLYCYADPVDFADRNGHDGDMITLMVVNFTCATLNSMSMVADLRAKNYSAAAVDLFGVAASLVGGGGLIGPGAVKALATVDGVYLSTAQIAMRAKMLQYLGTALGAAIAGHNVAMSITGGSGSGTHLGDRQAVPRAVHQAQTLRMMLSMMTLAGSGNITSKYTLTTSQALNAGTKWLGANIQEMGKSGSGVFRNVVNGRQFRIDDNSIAGNHNPNVPHVHFEQVDLTTGRVTVNNHVPFTN
jgi:RHS repeat-associated protein